MTDQAKAALEEAGYEIVVGERDTSRRTHAQGGFQYYFSADEETARDAEEAAWEGGEPARRFSSLRTRRNQFLDESDWVVAKALEAGEAVPDLWKSYRQSLRDLPATLNNTSVLSFDMETGWPAKP